MIDWTILINFNADTVATQRAQVDELDAKIEAHNAATALAKRKATLAAEIAAPPPTRAAPQPAAAAAAVDNRDAQARSERFSDACRAAATSLLKSVASAARADDDGALFGDAAKDAMLATKDIVALNDERSAQLNDVDHDALGAATLGAAVDELRGTIVAFVRDAKAMLNAGERVTPDDARIAELVRQIAFAAKAWLVAATPTSTTPVAPMPTSTATRTSSTERIASPVAPKLLRQSSLSERATSSGVAASASSTPATASSPAPTRATQERWAGAAEAARVSRCVDSIRFDFGFDFDFDFDFDWCVVDLKNMYAHGQSHAATTQSSSSTTSTTTTTTNTSSVNASTTIAPLVKKPTQVAAAPVAVDDDNLFADLDDKSAFVSSIEEDDSSKRARREQVRRHVLWFCFVLFCFSSVLMRFFNFIYNTNKQHNN